MNIKKIMGITIVAAISTVGLLHALPCSHLHENDAVRYSSSNRAIRGYCPKHGEWNMRYSFNCPGCMAPKYIP